MNEKPFEPTPQRLARARREGDVARCADLGAVAALGCGCVAVAAAFGSLVPPFEVSLALATHGQIAIAPLLAIPGFALAAAAVAALGSLLASIAMTGGLVVRAPQFKLERFNPAVNLRRMLGGQALVAIAKSVAVCCALGAALAVALADLLAAAAERRGIAGVVSAAQRALVLDASFTVAIALGFACVDFALEWRRRRRRLRMSAHEVKEEQRQSEGDPHQRARRRRTHRALATASITGVRRAAFVVANPTHVCVALEYRPPLVCVPRVVARGGGDAALSIRREAVRLEIAVVENAALARRLYARLRCGDAIAREDYDAVAQIVAALMAAGRLAA